MEEVLAQRRTKLVRDLLIIIVSIVLAFILHTSQSLETFLKASYGLYFVFGAFLTGIFFASTFTVAIAISIFLFFAQTHNPVTIALIGGLGAFVGDAFIFKFLREDLIADFEYLEQHFPKKVARRIIHSKLILWFAPIVAAAMIASPLPDELGLILLAGIKLHYRYFFLLSFALNTLGILIVALFGKAI